MRAPPACCTLMPSGLPDTTPWHQVLIIFICGLHDKGKPETLHQSCKSSHQTSLHKQVTMITPRGRVWTWKKQEAFQDMSLARCVYSGWSNWQRSARRRVRSCSSQSLGQHVHQHIRMGPGWIKMWGEAHELWSSWSVNYPMFRYPVLTEMKQLGTGGPVVVLQISLLAL